MSWEKRERGGRYYTRSRRVAGRVVREYVGSGTLAELAFAQDAHERGKREVQTAAWRAERERLETTEAALNELCDLGEAAAHASLLLAGYRRHHRGEWRQRRG